jgi:hypothetical protein
MVSSIRTNNFERNDIGIGRDAISYGNAGINDKGSILNNPVAMAVSTDIMEANLPSFLLFVPLTSLLLLVFLFSMLSMVVLLPFEDVNDRTARRTNLGGDGDDDDDDVDDCKNDDAVDDEKISDDIDDEKDEDDIGGGVTDQLNGDDGNEDEEDDDDDDDEGEEAANGDTN